MWDASTCTAQTRWHLWASLDSWAQVSLVLTAEWNQQGCLRSILRRWLDSASFYTQTCFHERVTWRDGKTKVWCTLLKSEEQLFLMKDMSSTSAYFYFIVGGSWVCKCIISVFTNSAIDMVKGMIPSLRILSEERKPFPLLLNHDWSTAVKRILK